MKARELLEKQNIHVIVSRTQTHNGFVTDEYYSAEVIDKLIDEAPVVYGYENAADYNYYRAQAKFHTHTARLMFIQPIEKKCEQHEPSKITSFRLAVDLPGNEYYTHITKCQYCGVELKATWSEK